MKNTYGNPVRTHLNKHTIGEDSIGSMRRGRIENIVTTGNTGARKGRGRSKEKISDGLTKWHGRSTKTELMDNMKDQKL